MSVLACDRNGCENIMCDRFSDELQAYICWRCFDELVESGITANPEQFLQTYAHRSIKVDKNLVRQHFDSIFPMRD